MLHFYKVLLFYRFIYIVIPFFMLRLKKSLGQHFLKDNNIARKIVHALPAAACQAVVEIGPGEGVLTQFLLERNDIPAFYIIEIDRRLPEVLSERFPSLQATQIINQDVLRVDFAAVFPEKIGVIGNFPYNISTQIVFKVLEHRAQVQHLVGMFQKEVAKRICANEKHPDYGITSVLTQAYYKAKYLFDVSPQVFAPPPKVMSGVLHLERHYLYEDAVAYPQLKAVVKAGFGQRRKMLGNALKSYQDRWHRTTLPAWQQRRAEQLSVAEWVQLAKELAE